eukprot:332849_1
MAHEYSHYFNSLSPDKYLRRKEHDTMDPCDTPDRREIGDEALSWELSSAKSGHGVQQLRDDNLTTFWQSDGMVPHKVIVLFHKKQVIENIAIYTDYKLDESYTPQEIIIKASSSSLHNYENHIVTQKSLNEPSGWIQMPLHPHKRQNKFDKYLKTNRLIFEIRSSHQSGRDTHIRQIKIYAPHSANTLHSNDNKSMLNHQVVHEMRNNLLSDSDDDDDDEDDQIERNKKLVFQSQPINSPQFLQYQSIR